jgi:hypothetical protein
MIMDGAGPGRLGEWRGFSFLFLFLRFHDFCDEQCVAICLVRAASDVRYPIECVL